MSERVTRSDVETVASNLNQRLEVRGSQSRVRLQSRYDYLAADEYVRDPKSCTGEHMARTLTAGTKREVYEALWNMLRGIDLITILP
jgi:hypothetical protein